MDLRSKSMIKANFNKHYYLAPRLLMKIYIINHNYILQQNLNKEMTYKSSEVMAHMQILHCIILSEMRKICP